MIGRMAALVHAKMARAQKVQRIKNTPLAEGTARGVFLKI